MGGKDGGFGPWRVIYKTHTICQLGSYIFMFPFMSNKDCITLQNLFPLVDNVCGCSFFFGWSFYFYFCPVSIYHYQANASYFLTHAASFVAFE